MGHSQDSWIAVVRSGEPKSNLAVPALDTSTGLNYVCRWADALCAPYSVKRLGRASPPRPPIKYSNNQMITSSSLIAATDGKYKLEKD